MPNTKELFSKTNIIIFGGAALVMLYIAFVFVKATYFGANLGDACSQATDCKAAVPWCMKEPEGTAKFCSHACVSDAACPAGWTCGDSGYDQVLSKSTGPVGIAHGLNVCWKPGKGAPPMRQ